MVVLMHSARVKVESIQIRRRGAEKGSCIEVRWQLVNSWPSGYECRLPCDCHVESLSMIDVYCTRELHGHARRNGARRTARCRKARASTFPTRATTKGAQCRRTARACGPLARVRPRVVCLSAPNPAERSLDEPAPVRARTTYACRRPQHARGPRARTHGNPAPRQSPSRRGGRADLRPSVGPSRIQ